MIQGSIYYPKGNVTAREKQIRGQTFQVLFYLGIFFLTAGLGYWMFKKGPDPSIIAWILFFVGAVAIILQPRWGIYLSVFFSLLGDSSMAAWYPFTKNFSSGESIFFIQHSIIISPLEVYIAITALSWLVRVLVFQKIQFRKGQLFLPALIFLGFIIFGLIVGLTHRGDSTIALWEVRPFFYLFALIVFGSNLLTQRRHFNHLVWLAVIAIFLKCIYGVIYFYAVLNGHSSGNDFSITDHSASIQIDSVFVLFLAAWLYRGSFWKRLGLLAMLPIYTITYLASQRRAAMVALAVAILIVALLLFFENRKVFWLVVPAFALLTGIYLIAFWNSSTTAGLPARAIKSVIAPSSLSYRDQSSNIYRMIENVDTGYTIKQSPWTGVGFGNKFYIIWPLPDISFFAWWNYFPHNSIIYIWVKTGIGGFISMLYFIGMTIITGAQSVMQIRERETRMIILTAFLYALMHFLFAYVDIAWDIPSMVYLGASIGMINTAGYVLATPEPEKKKSPWLKSTDKNSLSLSQL
jgi:O-antigen ligase